MASKRWWRAKRAIRDEEAIGIIEEKKIVAAPYEMGSSFVADVNAWYTPIHTSRVSAKADAAAKGAGGQRKGMKMAGNEEQRTIDSVLFSRVR